MISMVAIVLNVGKLTLPDNSYFLTCNVADVKRECGYLDANQKCDILIYLASKYHDITAVPHTEFGNYDEHWCKCESCNK